MTRRESDRLTELTAAIAAEDATAVLASAREAALRRASATLEDALYEELLAAVARLRSAAGFAEPHAESPEDREGEGEGVRRAGGEAGELCWAYCVLPARDAADLPPAPGVAPGTETEVLAEDELAVLVSRVPVEDYDDRRLREHLEDIAWVERTARAHETVIERALDAATVVPLRLCTLYRDLEGARRLLTENRARFAETLGRVEGCVELGLHVFWHRTAPPGTPHPSKRSAAAPKETGGPTGAAYLAWRRRERDEAELAAEERRRQVEEIHRNLSLLARDAVVNSPQRRELHGREADMVLNSAYLVERDQEQQFREAAAGLAEDLARAGLGLEVTGPWPPYNFVSGPVEIVS